jgi:carbonic anhydrase
MIAHFHLLTELFKKQEKYAESLNASFFRKFLTKQEPYITLVTCSDSRVQPEVFGVDTINNIFSVRNIGNQIINSLGSVDYGVNHLKTPLLIILGHVRCGAITAALQDYKNETFATIRELNNLCTALEKLKDKTFGRFHDKIEEAVLENIHLQVEFSLKRYREKVEKGELTIIGALYDFANLYGKGKGNVLLVNVNGLKTKEEILERVPEKERELWKEFLDKYFIQKHWYMHDTI